MPVNPNSLSLNSIVNVIVEISPLAAARATFNQALIVGTSTAIPSLGSNSRIRKYEYGTWSASMLSDGFAADDPEYLAAQIYFAQSPPPNFVWIGRQDLTALKEVVPTTGHEGTGYVIGDIITVTKTGASGGKCKVTGASSGTVTELTPILGDSGTGYSEATGLSTTTTGAGTGLQVDITEVGETPLVALQVCRTVNYDWYACLATEAVTADHKDIALWIESVQPSSVYFYTTADADVLEGTVGNIFNYLKLRQYSRVIGQYSVQPYAIAGAMGYAMGANTHLANSAYTLKFKREIGETIDALNLTQIANIEADNGNCYLLYNNYYEIFEQGKMANGQFFDEVINLDMLVNDIQLSVMDLLYQTPKVPQTDTGVTMIMHQINVACETAVRIGFLAPGVWNGRPILNLNTGDMLPKGYLVQAEAVADQSQADREARRSPPIYVSIKEAGAVHFVTIGVYVNR